MEHAQKLREAAESHQAAVERVRQQLLQAEEARDSLMVQFQQQREEFQAAQEFREVTIFAQGFGAVLVPALLPDGLFGGRVHFLAPCKAFGAIGLLIK